MAGAAAEGETPSPLLRCVHKCLTPSSSPSEPGPSVGSVGSAGPKLRRSSREHTCDGWRSPEQSALRQEQHEASILSLRCARGRDTTEETELGLEEPVLNISPESGDADARRVHRWANMASSISSSLPICIDPCTYFDDTSHATAGSAARAQYCLARRGSGKRGGGAERRANALVSPGRLPDAELGSRGHAGTAGVESPSDDPELVVALQMAKQVARPLTLALTLALALAIALALALALSLTLAPTLTLTLTRWRASRASGCCRSWSPLSSTADRSPTWAPTGAGEA